MADPEVLTRAFVVAHPGEAARVLEALPVEPAAALIAHLPARLAAPVVGAMLAPVAARLLGALDDERASGILASLGSQGAVALLRHAPEGRRVRLMDRLPTTTALAARLLLGYPEDAVGAWTDPDVVMLGGEVRAGDALAAVRLAGEAGGRIYVVDDARRLAGIVELSVLLGAPEELDLLALARPVAASLPAVTPLAAAADHPAWHEDILLPVVERGGALLGVLRRATLARARARARVTGQGTADFPIAAILAGGYWRALATLLEAVVALLPSFTDPAGGPRAR